MKNLIAATLSISLIALKISAVLHLSDWDKYSFSSDREVRKFQQKFLLSPSFARHHRFLPF